MWTCRIACDYSLVSLVVHYHLWLFMMTHDYSWLLTFSVHDYWWSSTIIYDCLWLLVNIQYLWLSYFWLFNGILALYVYIYIVFWYMYCDACLGWPQTLKSLLAPSSHSAIIYLQQHLRQLCIYNGPLMTPLQYFFLHALSTAWSFFQQVPTHQRLG